MTAPRRRQTLHKGQHNNPSSGSNSNNNSSSGNNNAANNTSSSANAKDRRDKGAAGAAAKPPTRVINAAPSLEKAEMYGIDDDRPVFSRAMALAGRMFIETIPHWLAIGAMLALIFGGCCSNVFALEAIIKLEPASGRS